MGMQGKAVEHIWNNPNQNLSDDYLSAAYCYLLAAKKVWSGESQRSTEWMFGLENPFMFLLAHATELILKSILAQKDKLESVKKIHDLKTLLCKVQEVEVKINNDFISLINTISENFYDHDYRYPRVFAGYPDEKREEMSSLQKTKPNEHSTKKAQRQYGLAVKSGVAVESSISLVDSQIKIISEWKLKIKNNHAN